MQLASSGFFRLRGVLMNWKHSLYEIYALSFGQSYTILEAHRILSELKQDRLFSIATVKAEALRSQGKIVDNKALVREYEESQHTGSLLNVNSNASKANYRRSLAAIKETDARYAITIPTLEMAKLEISFIELGLKHIETALSDVLDSLGVNSIAEGYQYVQPIEYAVQYVDAAYLQSAQYFDLVRNIRINPYADVITSSIKEALSPYEFMDTLQCKFDLPKGLFIQHGSNLDLWNTLSSQSAAGLLEYSKSIKEGTLRLVKCCTKESDQAKEITSDRQQSI